MAVGKKVKKEVHPKIQVTFQPEYKSLYVFVENEARAAGMSSSAYLRGLVIKEMKAKGA